MNFDPNAVLAEVVSGTSFVCAMCERFWEGKARRAEGLPSFEKHPNQICSSDRVCGSPFAGDVFSEYLGPLTDMTKRCFVCGGKPKFGVRVRNLARVVGVCEKHERWFVNFFPKFEDGKKEVPFRNRELLT